MQFTGSRIDAAIAKAKQDSRTDGPQAIVHDSRRGFAVARRGHATDGLRVVASAIDGHVVHS